MKKRMNFFLSSAMAVVLLFGVVQSASAIFWGWEDDPGGTTDWADGICAYRETCRTYYVLCIPVDSECTTETIGCIE